MYIFLQSFIHKNLLPKNFFGVVLILSLIAINTSSLAGQCSQAIDIPDASNPVDGNFSNSACTVFTFDPAVTGLPIGLSMNLIHTWQGDLSIAVLTEGYVLNVMQRPGTDNCEPGCHCGSSNNLNGLYFFLDWEVNDPDSGMLRNGGYYGVTQNDPCGIGNVFSFEELWSSFSIDEPITAQICIWDHAYSDEGTASDISFIFPDPDPDPSPDPSPDIICGCLDPSALNYDPAASIDPNLCLYSCPDLNLIITPNNLDICGGEPFDLEARAYPNHPAFEGIEPTYEWTSTSGNNDFIVNPTSHSTVIETSEDFIGTIGFQVIATFEYDNGYSSFSCSDTTSIEISIHPPPVVEIIGPDSACSGEEVELTAIGDFAYVYWPENEVIEAVNHVLAGSDVVVLVEDVFGCIGEASFVVEAFPPVTPVIESTNLVCFDQWETNLHTTEMYSTYLWSTDATTPSIIITEPGEYELTVVDANGCEGVTSFYAEGAPAVGATITQNQDECEDEEVLLTLIGGPFETITWLESGETLDSILVPIDSIVQVEVIDSFGCTNRIAFETDVVLPIVPVIEGTNLLCFEEGEGEIHATAPFDSYLWSTGDTLEAIMITEPGEYELMTVDSNGCEGAALFNVDLAPPVAVSIVGPEGVCEGEEIYLEVQGGPFQSITWLETGETTLRIVVSEPGDVQVLVEDTMACMNTATFIVNDFLPIDPVIEGENELCFENGVTQLSVLDDVFIDYFWSTGENSNTITVFDPGNYEVIVVDVNGCVSSTNFVVTQAAPIMVDIMGETQFCEGTSTTLSVDGSWAIIQWFNGGASTHTDVVDEGIYRVRVTDYNGCEGDTSIEVTVLPLPNPVIQGASQFCEGTSTTLSVEELYNNIQWSTGEILSSIDIVDEGIYTVTVTGDNGCEGEAGIDIVVLPSPIPIIQGDNQFCEGTSATLSLDESYSNYEWSTGETTPSIIVTTAGTYDVTVIDENGCSNTRNFDVEVSNLDFELHPTHLNCFGEQTGSAVAIVTDGIPPYIYQWDNGMVSNTVSGLGEGAYAVTITDGIGCIATKEGDIYSPDSINIVLAITDDNSTTPEPDGRIDAIVTGGTPFYYFDWNTGEIADSIENLAEGYYELTITDFNECVKDTLVQVSSITLIPDGFDFLVIPGGGNLKEAVLKLYPNPSTQYFNIEYNGLLPMQNIKVLSLDGKSVPFNMMETSHEGTFSLDLPQVASGSYILSFKIGEDYFFKKIVVQK